MIGRERIEFVKKIDDLFERKVIRLQDRMISYVIDYFTDNLDIKDGRIVSSNKNTLAAQKIFLVQQEFRRRETSVLLKWMVRKYIELFRLNTAYFVRELTVPIDIRKTIQKELLAQLGVNVVRNKASIIKGGRIDMIGDISTPFVRVNEMATNASAQGMPMNKFNEDIRRSLKDGSQRTLIHHFRTNAFDSYAQFDRSLQKNYADKLGLRAWIWEGGVIKGTRDFPCREYNEQIFIDEEIEHLRDKKWAGKNKNYDPHRDLGGHNCRHHKSYISNRLAIKRRPELKDKLEGSN